MKGPPYALYSYLHLHCDGKINRSDSERLKFA